MLPGSLENNTGTILPAPATKKYRHNQSMGEPDFDSVHKTIACSLQNCEIVVVSRVRDNIVDYSGHSEEASRGLEVVNESQRKEIGRAHV